MFVNKPTIEYLNENFNIYLIKILGIEFIGVTENTISAKMPVDERTFQAFRILHGGASVVLAETLGSIAANCCVDFSKQYCVGLEVNANHIRSVKEGFVYAKASPIHIGKSTHVWEIILKDEVDKITCISRLTMSVLNR